MLAGQSRSTQSLPPPILLRLTNRFRRLAIILPALHLAAGCNALIYVYLVNPSFAGPGTSPKLTEFLPGIAIPGSFVYLALWLHRGPMYYALLLAVYRLWYCFDYIRSSYVMFTNPSWQLVLEDHPFLPLSSLIEGSIYGAGAATLILWGRQLPRVVRCLSISSSRREGQRIPFDKGTFLMLGFACIAAITLTSWIHLAGE